jgi:hypothetical protein
MSWVVNFLDFSGGVYPRSFSFILKNNELEIVLSIQYVDRKDRLLIVIDYYNLNKTHIFLCRQEEVAQNSTER